MLNIPVILGSVREGRNSEKPAKFLIEKITALGHQTQLVDFKEMPLPFFDSALTPVAMKGVYPYPNVQKWSGIAQAADAFVLVFPEYNHGYNAVIKNALDWLFNEFSKKPFLLCGVSDGSFGGARAIEQMRPIVENFRAVAIREAITFSKADKLFDAEGKLLDESYNKRIDSSLENLVWWAEALKKARE